MSQSTGSTQSAQPGQGPKEKKMDPKPFLKHQTIGVIGNFGPQVTVKQIGGAIERLGGTFAKDETLRPTHLICSPDVYANPGKRVQDALRRGLDKCPIVEYQWLKDCIKHKALLPTEGYQFPLTPASLALSEKLHDEWQMGKAVGECFVNGAIFHPLQDNKGFAYNVTLTREGPGNGDVERYVMYLFESNAKPHLYWFGAKHFKKKGALCDYYRPSNTQQLLSGEMELFVNFFRKKTGVSWDERLVKEGDPGRNYFTYERPRFGRPTGPFDNPSNLPDDYNVELLGLFQDDGGAENNPTESADVEMADAEPDDAEPAPTQDRHSSVEVIDFDATSDKETDAAVAPVQEKLARRKRARGVPDGDAAANNNSGLPLRLSKRPRAAAAKSGKAKTAAAAKKPAAADSGAA